MRRPAEVANKRDLLEKGQGWVETLDWFLQEQPSVEDVQKALAQVERWNPTELRGKLHRYGQVEALEWLLRG